jgi:hypothetical protein
MKVITPPFGLIRQHLTTGASMSLAKHLAGLFTLL